MSTRQGLELLLLAVACLGFSTPALAGFAATDSYLLSVGRGPGLLGSEWYTTVWVHNPNEADATVRFSFLERDRDNTSPLVYDDTIPAGSVRKYNDVVFTMFGVEEFGAIRVVSDLPLVVASRVYSQPAEGEAASVGQFLPGVPATFAIGRGEATNLIGVRQHSPPDSWDFRYNYGVVETTGASVTVKISAYHQNNGFMRDKTVALRPFEAKQWNVSDLLAGGTAWNWRLEVEVIDGTGRVIAFGSGIANGSNDPSTFEMQYDDSHLAGGLTLPFTGSVSEDGGAVFDVTNTAAAGTGIVGRGGTSGGSFSATDGSAEATLGLRDTGGTGVWAGGNQEGDEVGTYTRGTARLSGGEAWVELGETFEWVTNPDLGLTVHLTPVGSWSQLYVAERSTSRLLVRSAGGDPNAQFDYVVMGLRIGFEEASVVQEKWCDAPIPSMVSVEERYRREPELREHTARARFEGMLLDTGEPTPLDLSATEALGEAVGRARPAQ